MTYQTEKWKSTERAVARFLREQGLPMAITSRAALGHNGTRQPADIIGTPGVSIEVKHRRELNIGPALTQAAIQGGPNKLPVVVAKPYGVGLDSVQEFWAITYFGDFVKIMPREGEL